jgi:protein phosphatase
MTEGARSFFMLIKAIGKTDIGLVRKANEDSIKLLPDKQLYIVCDGMGGHNAGEVASQTACEMIASLYGSFFDRLLQDDQVKLPRVFPKSTDVLTKSVRIANHCIHKMALDDPSMSGMGTTIAAIAFEYDIMTILHVGDSRIYRFVGNKLTPLTIDHSWAAELEQTEKISSEEAKTLVNRNVITRALGVKESVEIDVAVRKVAENDIYIICSDGLCGLVENPDIEHVAAQCNEDLEKITTQLVRLANDRGGTDNVSVIAVKITGKVEPSELHKMDAVTVDGEPTEYFEAEEQWGASATEIRKPDEKVENAGQRNYTALLGTVFIAVLIAALIYIMFKG